VSVCVLSWVDILAVVYKVVWISKKCPTFVLNIFQYWPFYVSVVSPSVMVMLGKFKREDLARALLCCMVLDLVQCVQLVSNCHGIKRVFFCGGFASTPLVRSIITTEYVRRNLLSLSFGMVTRLSFSFLSLYVKLCGRICALWQHAQHQLLISSVIYMYI